VHGYIFLGFSVTVIQKGLAEWCVFLVNLGIKESFSKLQSEKVVCIVGVEVL
jgi:hypothetical protein